MGTVRIGRYRPYKGQEVTVIRVAVDRKIKKELVIYRKEFGDHGLRVRPKDQFLGTVEVEGEMVPRFQYLGRK